MPKILNKPSEEQLRRWLLEERKSTDEVAALVGVTRQAVWTWKKQMGIQVGFIQPFTRDDLEYRYYELGETQRQIGEFFGVDQVRVSHWMIKWGLDAIPPDERNEIVNPVVLSDLQEDIIRGTMLGDGHLRPYTGGGSGKNSWYVVDHGDKQREYIKHLEESLRPYTARPPFRYWRDDDRCKNGGVWTTTFRTRAHRFWTGLRDVWYPGGVKVVPEQELAKLNARSLAYLYADDGSRAGMASNLYTLSFTREENELLADYLLRLFNLSTDVRRFSGSTQYYLHIKRLNTQLLMEIIEPYLSGLSDISKKLVPKGRARAI
jgi:hypothetical protein